MSAFVTAYSYIKSFLSRSKRTLNCSVKSLAISVNLIEHEFDIKFF